MVKLGLSVNSWLAKQIRDKQVQSVELLKKSLEFSCHQCMTHGWLQMHSLSHPGSGLSEKYAYNGRGGGSESLRISFLGAVYGFKVSFLSLCIFLG